MPAVSPTLTHVATLVSHTIGVGERHARAVAASLPGAAAPCWLEPSVAVDIAFAPPPDTADAGWNEAARQALGGEAVDAVVQPIASRCKRLLVIDMDATIIREECIDELAALAGQGEAVSALTRASVRGEIEFEASLRRRVALLAGLPVEAVVALASSLTLDPGAATLVATMRARGAVTVLASGGFTRITAAIAARIGFDWHRGNLLEIADGRLTGRLSGSLLGPAAKSDILRASRAARRLAPHETLAAGDGANDLPMLTEAGLGVAYRAAPAVAAAARARIDHSDLRALLYIQGLSSAEFRGGAAP